MANTKAKFDLYYVFGVVLDKPDNSFKTAQNILQSDKLYWCLIAQNISKIVIVEVACVFGTCVFQPTVNVDILFYICSITKVQCSMTYNTNPTETVNGN